jgi:hypothetical protein
MKAILFPGRAWSRSSAGRGLVCLLGLAGVLLGGSGCSGPSPLNSVGERPAAVAPSLSSAEAAHLAARLANDECERLYKRRPFKPDLYPALRQGTGYTWGRLDEGGPGGYSAWVRFASNGSQPAVEVYFSSDSRRPRR